LRGLAAEAAANFRRERVRKASETVGDHAAKSEAVERFYQD